MAHCKFLILNKKKTTTNLLARFMDNSFYYPLPSCKIFLSKNDFIKLHNLTLKKNTPFNIIF